MAVVRSSTSRRYRAGALTTFAFRMTTFLVPAAEMLASSFPQPIVLGDLRGALKPYPAFAERVAAALPDARLVVFDRSGHGLHWEDPVRTAAELAWIDARIAAGAARRRAS